LNSSVLLLGADHHDFLKKFGLTHFVFEKFAFTFDLIHSIAEFVLVLKMSVLTSTPLAFTAVEPLTFTAEEPLASTAEEPTAELLELIDNVVKRENECLLSESQIFYDVYKKHQTRDLMTNEYGRTAKFLGYFDVVKKPYKDCWRKIQPDISDSSLKSKFDYFRDKIFYAFVGLSLSTRMAVIDDKDPTELKKVYDDLKKNGKRAVDLRKRAQKCALFEQGKAVVTPEAALNSDLGSVQSDITTGVSSDGMPKHLTHSDDLHNQEAGSSGGHSGRLRHAIYGLEKLDAGMKSKDDCDNESLQSGTTNEASSSTNGVMQQHPMTSDDSYAQDKDWLRSVVNKFVNRLSEHGSVPHPNIVEKIVEDMKKELDKAKRTTVSFLHPIEPQVERLISSVGASPVGKAPDEPSDMEIFNCWVDCFPETTTTTIVESLPSTGRSEVTFFIGSPSPPLCSFVIML
jgi:hypothetical protein